VAALESEIAGKRTCTGPVGQEALRRLSQRLIDAGNPAAIDVRVVADPRVNAFAVPSGHVVIFQGLIDAAASPDEVAGVLAHEVSHVLNRHPQRAIVRYAGLAMLGSALFGDTNLAALAPVLLTLSYSRSFEREADESALLLLDRAGIDGGGLAAFFTRLERSRAGGGAFARGLEYLSTHPPSDERRRNAEQHRHDGAAAMTPSEWRALRAICA
jgi:predicted Zn-dependent protease